MKLMKHKLLGKNFAVDVRIVKEKEQKPSIFKRTKNFVVDVAVAAKNTVVDFAIGLWHHAESTTLLVLSSIGLSSLLAEIPFIFTVPMWFEGVFIIPVISVLLILALVKISEKRGYYRMEHV